jgi:uncharacterized iron-regulated protein
VPEKLMDLDETISSILDVPIIYVGEGHTRYEDHRVQLEVIKALFQSGRRFAIGMEMFQEPFQQSLDDYMSGETTEKDFLKSSEYFKRWKFNYHLYREIMGFARKNKIPVIALNQKQEVIRKVARSGLDSLSEEEKKEVPRDMDMTDWMYRQRLKEVFSQHSMHMGFENFFQSQILWDETMAHNVAHYLDQHPDMQMVVIAGSGHIAYGSGIPKRVYRLNRLKYTTIVNVKASAPVSGIADFVFFSEPEVPPSSPRLGVLINNSEDKGLKVLNVMKGSMAGRCGIKKGDILLCVDGKKVFGIEDVNIALFDKKSGDRISLKVLRKRFLLPAREKQFSVTVP